MYKLAKWLWRKSERTTAQSIIDMVVSFYLPPMSDTNMSAEEYKHISYMYNSSRTFIGLIERRFMPEIHEAEIQQEREMHEAMKRIRENQK